MGSDCIVPDHCLSFYITLYINVAGVLQLKMSFFTGLHFTL